MSTPQMLQHVADFVDLCFGDIEVNALNRFAARLLGPFFPCSLTVKNPMGGTPCNPRTMSAIEASKIQTVE